MKKIYSFAEYALAITIAAALVAIAGCSGGMTSQTNSLPSQNAGAFVHHGLPFAPPMLRSTVSHNTGGYPTNKSLVFEADYAEKAVNIYQTAHLADNPPPIATIHVAAGCPYGMGTDKEGTLYVADNCGGNDVEEYAKGSTTLKTTITNGISDPLGLAIDKKGTLYVTDYVSAGPGGEITVYPKGATSPSETITDGLSAPDGLALDKFGNLYIADSGARAVFELKAGSQSVTNLNLSELGAPYFLAVNKKAGLLWVTYSASSSAGIRIYQLGGSKYPINSIPGSGFPFAISLENRGRPKAEVVESNIANPQEVYAFKPGAYTPYATLTNGIYDPSGLLITKP
jgi:hypothetical protein